MICYSNQKREEMRFIHSLNGAFIKKSEGTSSAKFVNTQLHSKMGKNVYMVKIDLGIKKSRIMFFLTEEMQDRWETELMKACG